MKSLHTLCEAEMWDEALTELSKLADGSCREDRLQVERGWIEIGRGQYHRVPFSSEGLQKEGGPMAAPAAIALAHLGRHDEAIRLARLAVAQRRDGAEMAMGAVLEVKDDLEGALLWYERAAGRFRQRAPMMRQVSRLLTRIGSHAEARLALEQSVRLGRFVRSEDLIQLADCWSRLGRDGKAAACLELAADFRARDLAKAETLGLLAAETEWPADDRGLRRKKERRDSGQLVKSLPPTAP